MIAIATPTGNIGRVAAEELIAAGERISVLVRDPSRLSPIIAAGAARITRGSAADNRAVIEATRGATALLWVAPPNRPVADYGRWAAALLDVVTAAIRRNRISRVVHISGIGARDEQGAGLASLAGEAERGIEEVAAEVSAEVLHLRAAGFMENLLHQVPAIVHAGMIRLPVPGPQRGPIVATRDLAQVAARELCAPESWGNTPRVLDVMSPDDLTFDEVARVVSDVLVRPVRHVQISSNEFEHDVTASGCSADFARYAARLYARLATGELRDPPGTPTVITPTTLRAWAAQLLAPTVAAFAAGAAGGFDPGTPQSTPASN